MQDFVIYEPELGLNGTIPELVNWEEKYTSDYTDKALERTSELAMLYDYDEKFIKIPLLLRNERLKEGNGTLQSAYARLQIDHLLGNKISLSMSNFGSAGCELEIFQENDTVIIALSDVDENGVWSASSAWDMKEFINNAADWLDVIVGQVLFYNKVYQEETA